MPANVATINFGAFPGTAMASIAVVDARIGATDLVEAWIDITTSTADHSTDEHMVENFRFTARNNGAGVGFTIYGESDNPQNAGQGGNFIYGTWTVDWAFGPVV